MYKEQSEHQKRKIEFEELRKMELKDKNSGNDLEGFYFLIPFARSLLLHVVSFIIYVSLLTAPHAFIQQQTTNQKL